MKFSTKTGLVGLFALPLLVQAAGPQTRPETHAQAHTHAHGHAHVHGVATLDIAIEANRLSLSLEAPLQSLLGFERAPRGATEQQRADDLVASLKAADPMFRIDPAAGCKLASVSLTSAALRLGPPDAAEADTGHADLDGSFEFDCGAAGKAAYIDIGLFRFQPLQRVEVQVATDAGQFKRQLKRGQQRISLQRQPGSAR